MLLLLGSMRILYFQRLHKLSLIRDKCDEVVYERDDDFEEEDDADENGNLKDFIVDDESESEEEDA